MIWFDAEKRLPKGNGKTYYVDLSKLEESDPVVVRGYYIDERNVTYGIGTYVRNKDCNEEDGWSGSLLDGYDLEYCTITHWMNIPKFQKESSEPQ